MDADIYPASTNRGPLLLASAFTLHAITITVYLIRVYSRLTSRFALTAADYMITVAVVGSIFSSRHLHLRAVRTDLGVALF